MLKKKSNTTSPSRILATNLLTKILSRKSPIESTMNSDNNFNKLSIEDKKFCRLLLSETLRRFGQVNFILDKYLKLKIPKNNHLINVIRISVTEIVFINSSKYAAINDAVELIKLNISKSKANMANAVLRNIDREIIELRKNTNNTQNIPKWLIKSWRDSWGLNKLDKIINSFFKKPYLDISINGDPKTMSKSLDATFIFGKTLRKNLSGEISLLPKFSTKNKEEMWWVQDVAASIPAFLFKNPKGKKIIDLCAAPGGKSIQLLSLGADVTSVDINSVRMNLLEENLNRLGLKNNHIIEDAAKWVPNSPPDGVLIDAPCSSTGTIRKHPEIMVFNSQPISKQLLLTQKNLLIHSSKYIKINGYIIYTVCSIQKEEGELQIDSFLSKNKNFKISKILPNEVHEFQYSITKQGWMRIFPFYLDKLGGNDGFFICRLKRNF